MPKTRTPKTTSDREELPTTPEARYEPELWNVADEARGRLNVVIRMLADHVDHCAPTVLEPGREAADTQGYELSIMQEILAGVRDSLGAAGERFKRDWQAARVASGIEKGGA